MVALEHAKSNEGLNIASMDRTTVTNHKPRKHLSKSFMVAGGVRGSACIAKVPPKSKRTYFKAVIGLQMREEGTLELEDEYCREEIKEVFRD